MTYICEITRQNFLELQYTLKKNERQEGETGPFWVWEPVGKGRA
jgi:hypothetical protein